MCTERIRLIAVFSSIWTLIQGIGYLIIAVFGLLTYQCQMNMMRENKIGFFLYVIYFYNKDCAKYVNLGVLDPSLSELHITFASTPFTAIRTYDWCWVYIVISTLWILTSLILFFGSICISKGTGVYITLIPWALITVATLFADAIAAITYAIDIPNMMSWKGVADLIDMLLPSVIQFDDVNYTWIPSAIMVVFFSRIGIFWIINIILLIVVVVEGNESNNMIKQSATQQVGNKVFPVNMPIAHRNNDINPYIVQSMQRTFAKEVNRQDSPYLAQSATRVPMTNPRLNGEFEGSTLKKQHEKRQHDNRPYGPEELRSQLPWSYFQDRHEPKKAPTRMRSTYAGDTAPPVPVPDYTLHFPKRPRESEKGTPNKPLKISNELRLNSNARPSTTPSMNPYG